MAPIFRNYRFAIGAFAAIMLILLIKTSSTGSLSISRTVSPTASVPKTSGDVSTLPFGDKPGYIGNPKAEQDYPEMADAVKSQTSQKCSEEHRYVVMIDAGSSGSRVHVYEFDVCTSPPTLINEEFKMLTPGLSSYDTDAAGAAESLDSLLDFAVDKVPLKARGCTPVAVRATAGLRIIGDAKSKKILTAVTNHLEKDYPFPIAEGSVSIMDGDEEGVFAWITTNYLLKNIGTEGAKLPTAAVFDLGGGSTQIVFEPTFPENEKMVEGEHKYDLNFGGKIYTLYQFSHLRYGLMEGRKRINSVLVQNAIKDGKITKGDGSKTHKIMSPCLPPKVNSSNEKVELAAGETYTVDFIGPDVPTGTQCRFLTDQILNKDAKCQSPPCSFNGVHQPSMVRTFKELNDIYIFSFFYDRTHPLGMPSSFTLNELMDLTRTVCSGEETWKSVFSGIEGSLDELKSDPHYCLDLSFQVSLLHTGYDIPLYRELRTAEKIDDTEIGWSLGASLSLLESDFECKVSQIE
ncbi:Gda1p [Saccharomyces cerevisiae x Saccharomyces kudriavzevii VIN7]|uniref:Guanosine-diphosphatase n=1 Tax=Saccharomyces cerevisiae x Saccharomyces kudriavzevii (strain VIN7) TaxID=1095631 RepID=H0GTM6_SACCK|nr:Gda1p [Saccharomyces cerevisiae x Saccharomyces kudriavzevii VIN7]